MAHRSEIDSQMDEKTTNLGRKDLVIALLIEVGRLVGTDDDSVEPFDPASAEVARNDYPKWPAMVRA